jgi:hypothetical protein
MEKEIYVSRCLPYRNGVNTKIEKCPVNSIEEGRDYVQKLGWKKISSNEPFENSEYIEIIDSSRIISENGKTGTGFIERYIR